MNRRTGLSQLPGMAVRDATGAARWWGSMPAAAAAASCLRLRYDQPNRL
jgi:hypothetical protein